jgi:hypothetical protein
VFLGAGTTLGDNVTLGDGTTTEAKVTIEDDVSIGDESRIGPAVCIGAQATLGDAARVLTPWDCLVLHCGVHVGTAHPVVGDVLLRYEDECHPIAWWTPVAIRAVGNRYDPRGHARCRAVLTAWVAMARTTILPAGAP